MKKVKCHVCFREWEVDDCVIMPICPGCQIMAYEVEDEVREV